MMDKQVLLDNETTTQKERRIKNNKYLEDKGITTNDTLVCDIDESNVKLKSLDEIGKKAASSLLVLQIVWAINSGKDPKGTSAKKITSIVSFLLEKYKVQDALNAKEKRLMEGTYSKQDLLDLDWEYESYWALCWCLGLVDDISDASVLCDPNEGFKFVVGSLLYENFIKKCKLRDVSELIDMYDLYRRYFWALNNKKFSPNTRVGNIDEYNVWERLRALQWVLTDIKDWYDIKLHL